MSSINSLLNHGSAAPASQSAPTTTYEAADALTTLATLGGNQQFAPAPTRELPSPTAFSSAPRRSSSFGGGEHAPVEPSPPVEQAAIHSPTLDLEQYHHGSQSPEEQKRRQSLMSRSSPAPVLAPIHNLSSALQEHIVPSSEVSETSRDSKQHRHEPELANNLQTNDTQSASAQLDRQSATTTDNMDLDALKALEVAKQADLGLRTKRTASVAESIPSPIDSKAPMLPSKKRPAPSVTAVKKKGTAKAMKPSKKRKLDTDDSNPRSVTPTARTSRPPGSRSNKKGSQAGTPGLESSPAPDNSSQVHASDDDGDSSEDHNLYCICKKPDNHKWMIGCDGGCDDWFHGDCVNMKQMDEELVDRFICPLCEESGKGHTTWKPMCRRDGCRKPARVTKDRESKYCSDACGALFMNEQMQRTAGAKGANGTKDKPKKPKKKSGKSDEIDGDEEEPTPLGGVLRAKDLKALVDASPNIQTFKNLGTGVLTPPQTASPNRATFEGAEDFAFTAGETERLNALHNEKSQLKDRLEVLKDREKFVSMAKEQAGRVAEREKIKLKEFCGYDSRLSWSDAEFLHWRNSKHGRAAFEFNTLSPTAEQVATITEVNGADAETEAKESVCLKKRCPKHPQWQKLNLQDARFEELEVFESLRECEKEEKSVRERAMRRGAKDAMAKELTAGDGSNEARNREGWVEVIAS